MGCRRRVGLFQNVRLLQNMNSRLRRISNDCQYGRSLSIVEVTYQGYDEVDVIPSPTLAQEGLDV